MTHVLQQDVHNKLKINNIPIIYLLFVLYCYYCLCNIVFLIVNYCYPFLSQSTTGVLISNTLQEELNVHLEPKNITVCEGESVTVNCTFQPAGKYKVKLYYSLTPDLDITSTTDRASEKWHKSEKNDTWSTFIISSIKTDDSGWYFCEVTIDIPVLVKKCSDGIQVLVGK